jgi:maleylacetate reductase
MTMLSGTHRYPRQDEVVYGRPAGDALIEAARSNQASRLLVTTTKSLAGPDGLASKVAAALGGLCVGIFPGITAHSPREAVIHGAREARRLECDLLVAVGGGSVIDATKVMQLCVWADIERPEELDRYRAGARADRVDMATIRGSLRMVAVPTTLSAAEFTPFAGVTDSQRRVKEGYAHPDLAPRCVVLDPAMTLQTPLPLWFSTGLKAIDHGIEQLCNPKRAPMADTLAAEGVRHLLRGLPATKRMPTDVDARLDCQFGMWFAISGASAGHGMGASHAIGHTLGGMFGVPHGLTSCVILPAVLRWNEAVDADRQRFVRELVGLPASQSTLSDTVKGLCRALDLPTTLESVGIASGQFRAIAEHTMGDRAIRSNARRVHSANDIVEILELARS